jgi:hypothetical protein
MFWHFGEMCCHHLWQDRFGLGGCQGDDTQDTILSVMKKSFKVVPPITAVEGSKRRQHYLEPMGAESHKQCAAKA